MQQPVRFLFFTFIFSFLLLTTSIFQKSLFAQIDTTRRPFVIDSYKILLDWREPFKTKLPMFSGSSDMHVRLEKGTPSINLDAYLMDIDSIYIDGKSLIPVPQPTTKEQVAIPLPTNLQQQGKEFALRVVWRRTSNLNEGFHFYKAKTFVGFGEIHDSVFVEEDLAYTMSEPLNAHYWMPCLDLPYNKAASEITIIVPKPYSAQSNGALVSVTELPDSSRAYHWVSDKPLASYLMVADASNFIEWHDYYQRISNPQDSVRLLYYAWPSDYNETEVKDGTKYNAQNALRNTPLMMREFSKRFGEYPFKQYGQVPVQPFDFGGMEHQGMSTINRRWLRGFDDDGIAHELAHQWFGDKTTCETWRDIWLNESFASFCEFVWEEAANGKDAYLALVRETANNYFRDDNHHIPIYAPPLEGVEGVFNTSTVYYKGSCVLHMLRKQLQNDTLFFNSLKDYSSNFAYTTANTEQAIEFFKKRMNRDLTDFFDQWIYGPLNPEYNVTWAQGSDNKVILRVEQTQTAQDHFTLSLPFYVTYTNSKTDTLWFANTERLQEFQFSASNKVRDIKFGKDEIILSTATVVKNASLAVRLSEENFLYSIVSSQGRQLTTLDLKHGIRYRYVQLFDALGRKVWETPFGESSTQVALPSLSSGTYTVAITSENGIAATRTLAIIR